MKKIGSVIESLGKSINFINHHIIAVLPFSALFFAAILAYSITWYALDLFSGVSCLNGNYAVQLLFCKLYLGVLGKHIIAMVVSSLSIVPFAALVYFTNKVAVGNGRGIVSSIKNSAQGIAKIIIFRAGLTIVLFSPFIIYLMLGGNIISSEITETGRLTLQKLFMIDLLPIPVTLLLGFALIALLEPVFQYVEYEVLVLGSRIRDAVKSSYRLAVKYPAETFITGFAFVIIWDVLIGMKFLYLAHPYLALALVAAIFLESFLVFPLRAVFLYFLWRDFKTDYGGEVIREEAKKLKSYTNRMLLG